MRRAALAAALLVPLLAAAARSDERIVLEAEIDGKPVRLGFDTGAADPLLFGASARRLGLAPEAGGDSLEALLQVYEATATVRVRVVELPPYAKPDVDGVIPWRLVRDNRLAIDAGAGTLTPYASANITPREDGAWIKLEVSSRTDALTLQAPGPDGREVRLGVAAGSPNGVQLPEPAWRRWRAEHPAQPVTLDAFQSVLGKGVEIKEESWASELTVGPLRLTDVPVFEGDASTEGADAVLGFAALRRVQLLVDARAGVAYVVLKPRPGPPYEHNRLGAVFVPGGPDRAQLVARVAPGSPAFEAGLRDGDVLLTIDGLDATAWRTDPRVLPLSRFFRRKAGTRLRLTVSRDGVTRAVDATLRQLLPPRP